MPHANCLCILSESKTRELLACTIMVLWSFTACMLTHAGGHYEIAIADWKHHRLACHTCLCIALSMFTDPLGLLSVSSSSQYDTWHSHYHNSRHLLMDEQLPSSLKSLVVSWNWH